MIEITGPMIEAATDAYEFGVYPGDESEPTREELRAMAERVLRAGLETAAEDWRALVAYMLPYLPVPTQGGRYAERYHDAERVAAGRRLPSG